MSKHFTLISLEKVIRDYRKFSKRRNYLQCLLISKVRKYITGFHLSDCYISSSFWSSHFFLHTALSLFPITLSPLGDFNY